MEKIFVKNSHWISTKKIIDGFDGILTVANEFQDIPFQIKRVYYIYNLLNHKKVQRGLHAHKTLEQVMFCINGSCTVVLDDGSKRQEILLDQPNKGVFLGTYLWHEMKDFKSNCILLVFASDFYDESDYIRDYNEFLDAVSNCEYAVSNSYLKTGSIFK